MTSNEYIHVLHWSLLHRECNSTIFESMMKYTLSDNVALIIQFELCSIRCANL